MPTKQIGLEVGLVDEILLGRTRAFQRLVREKVRINL